MVGADVQFGLRLELDATPSRSRNAARSTVSPFQNIWLEPSIESAIWSGCVRLGVLAAFGRSIFTACVSSGAVMMKITSSTSITSMSGIMLISAIGRPPAPDWSNPPNAIYATLLVESDCGALPSRAETVFEVST